MRFATSVACVVSALVLLSQSASAQVVFTPSKDNTIYEGHTANSNGAGESLFVGRTRGLGSPPPKNRRALIAFDLSAIPPGSTVTDVTLTLDFVGSGGQPTTISMHRLLVDFGEGTSFGTGSGNTAVPPDATWIFRMTGPGEEAWGIPGGEAGTDYVAAASAVETDGTIASTPGLVADVQAWVDGTALNYGWMLIGNESLVGSVGRWRARQTTQTLPMLTVTYDDGSQIFADGFESGDLNAWSSSNP